jgi:hypothetical protein
MSQLVKAGLVKAGLVGARLAPDGLAGVDLHGGDDYLQKILMLNPLAIWPLGEAGGTVAYDYSGHGYNAAYGGNPVLGNVGKFGGICPKFDGNDYVNLYSAAFAAAFNPLEFTVACWFNSAFLTDATANYIWHIGVNTTTNYLSCRNTTTNNMIQDEYTAGSTGKSRNFVGVANSTWYHHALTVSVSADQKRTYFNAVQQGLTLATLGTWAGALGATTCVIGAQTSAGTSGWKDYIQWFGVWTRVLSASEIMSLYLG